MFILEYFPTLLQIHITVSIAARVVFPERLTAPAKVWKAWAAATFPLPEKDFVYKGIDKTGIHLRPISYKSLELSWESFDIHHDLTGKGIQQFVPDYKSTLKQSAEGCEPMTSSKYIILGGGMVAGYAAKELASRGQRSGELMIISADDALPYERPPLSKGFLSGKDTEDGILINKPEWYEKQGIDVKLQTIIDKFDLKKKRLHADSGEVFECETLLIATGASARKLECPGNDLPNVFYLRSVGDSRTIREKAANSKQAVVIGGGFIGMEVASVLSQRNIETSLIIREDRVGSRVFTPAMSECFERHYLARGVKLLKNETVASLQAGDRLGVSLSSGRKILCDMVVAGVGASPVTDLFATSSLAVENGITVNEYLETNQAGIFAAGDVANYVDKLFDKRRRVEHWDNAVSQGQHWAGVIRGERQPFLHVPYFFSDVFDLSYELWGDSEGATQIVARGNPSSSSFSIWWLKQECLIAAFVMNRPEEERQCAPEWIKSKQNISADRLKDQNRPIQEAI